MSKIQKEEIITARRLWEKERQRCLNLKKEGVIHNWMKKQFGETLTEKKDMMS